MSEQVHFLKLKRLSFIITWLLLDLACKPQAEAYLVGCNAPILIHFEESRRSSGSSSRSSSGGINDTSS